MGAHMRRRHENVISDSGHKLQQLAKQIAAPIKTIVHKRRNEVDDRLFLDHRHAGVSFPHDKMAPLYVEPLRITKVNSPTSYELELLANMKIPRV